LLDEFEVSADKKPAAVRALAELRRSREGRDLEWLPG
jgi:hypothetical protein